MIMKKKIFIKVSGDLIDKDTTIKLIAEKTHDAEVVVCVGGGTQINEVFQDANISLRKHGPLGREHQSDFEKNLAAKVLNENVTHTKSLLKKKGVFCKVIPPILDIGKVYCHVNGDQMVLASYLGFDELYILTTVERASKKRQEFSLYPKVLIMAI